MVASATTMNGLIHRAVLRDLRRFDSALERFPAGDGTRASALAELFARFDAMLTGHHESEETHLWPVLRGRPADTAEVAQLSGEQERIVGALAAARPAMQYLGSTAAAGDAAAARAAVGGCRRL